jgi:hypothetical protein
VVNASYLLAYAPVSGYVFLNWTVTGGITVRDPYAIITCVTLSSNGTVTAFYRACDISLSSRHWKNESSNLGFISFGSNVYSLPKELTSVVPGDYALQYTVHNASYLFLQWLTHGLVIPWNFTSDTTTVTVLGDGTLTALYYLITEEKPPFENTWDTLYLDFGHTIVPPYSWSGSNGKLKPYNIGKIQVVEATSPATPDIYLERFINVTAYIRPNPPDNLKSIAMKLGFTYNGTYYLLGNILYTTGIQGVYWMQIDILSQAEFPSYFGLIPKGSTIILTITAEFYKQPWGTFFVYYGFNAPTHVELY